ncbi:MAG: NADAR family protein [Bacteroidia bacterium]
MKKMEEKFTFFYHTSSPFSNWHPCEFEVEDIVFNCSEQYMMYGKAIFFEDEEMAERILAAKTPDKQKALGRKVRNFNYNLWREVAKDIVYKGCYAKFTQNEALKQMLLATAGTTLVEASPFDVIWGIGMRDDNPDRFYRSKWKGTNWLGEVLTDLREELLRVK